MTTNPVYGSEFIALLTFLSPFLLIANVSFAIMALIVAGDRGRGGCAWAILTLLLGPLAMFAMLLYPIEQEVLDAKMVKLNKMKWCKYCRRGIHIEATKCCHCQSLVE